ncbi:MAG: radical SAM protein [Candidatus Diapherotrites archaeon]|nr:radical SAM protein [Candidatus Diapherotrites archaeon]
MYIEVGGIVPNAADVMGKKGTVVYLQGCNFKCKYCYAGRYLAAGKGKKLNVQELAMAVAQTKPEAVVITGGEPCMQHRELEGLCRILRQVKCIIKVHTNGTFPGCVGNLVTENLVDYLVLDIKSPLDRPDILQKIDAGQGLEALQKVRESLDIAHLESFNGFFEVVYPVVTGVNDKEEFVRSVAKDVGWCSAFVVQGFDPQYGAVDPVWSEYSPPPQKKLEKLAEVARDTLRSVEMVSVRSHVGVETF